MKTLILPTILLALSLAVAAFAFEVRAELMTATVVRPITFPYVGPLQPAAPTQPVQGSRPDIQPALL